MMHHHYNRYSTSMLKMFFDVIFLLAAGLFLFDLQFSFSVIIWGAILGIFYAGGNIFYFLSIQKLAIEDVIPILQSTNILFIFLGAVIFLSEAQPWFKYIGVGSVLLGIYTLLSSRGFELPKFHKGYGILAISLVFHIGSALLTKYGLRGITSPISLAIVMYAFCTLFLLIFIVIYHTIDVPTIRYLKTHIKRIIIAAIFGAGGTFCLYTALSKGDASLVYPIAGIQSVFVYFIAVIFSKKKFSWKKLASIIAVCIGIGLIAL
jgi:uncharacterized membrane protein